MSEHDCRTCVRCAEGLCPTCPDHASLVDQGHRALAALIHCRIASDPQSDPLGFQWARDLGLVDGVNPTPTPLGLGILRALGLIR